MKNGEIVAAAEEERFSRLKNDRRFPMQAVNFCLEQAGIHQTDLAAVAFYDDAALTFERILHGLAAIDEQSARKMWDAIIPEWACTKLHFPRLVRELLRYDGLVLQGSHHRSHAASCFYPSPFEKAAILTVDGVGEWATAAIAKGDGQKINLLKEMHFPNSLGLLYSAFTHFTGFKVNSGEYKMMGLAPYGRPIYKDLILKEIVNLKDDGSIQMNMDYFSFLHDTSTTSDRFDELFGGPRRTPESPITLREMNIARSIQEVTEEALLRMANHARELTGEENLCMAGGVALNCVANGRLIKENPTQPLWIQPAAGDSGCALGVALDVWHTYFEQPRDACDVTPQGGSYLGPEFSSDEIKGYLDTHGYPFHQHSGTSRNELLAQKLAEGKVVGHFSGRLEYGPRSLGARSILGDARNTEMQVNLNLRIKYRESFRPFAPAVLQEQATDFFEIDCDSPYMLVVAPVRQERRLPFSLDGLADTEDMLPVVREPRSDVPAITHVDYSARVQTVRSDFHSDFYDLITQFERQTGVGLVVNTSFNVRGEPIVCTPYDAYRCFMRTEMDVLALGDFVLFKEEQPTWPEPPAKGLELEDAPSGKAEERSGESSQKSLVGKLSRVFESEFLPRAQKLRQANVLRISLQPMEVESTWVQLTEPSPSELFSYGKAHLATNESPPDSAIAEEISRRWCSREAAELMTDLVAKILATSEPWREQVKLDEQVSESVYAMF